MPKLNIDIFVVLLSKILFNNGSQNKKYKLLEKWGFFSVVAHVLCFRIYSVSSKVLLKHDHGGVHFLPT